MEKPKAKMMDNVFFLPVVILVFQCFFSYLAQYTKKRKLPKKQINKSKESFNCNAYTITIKFD